MVRNFFKRLFASPPAKPAAFAVTSGRQVVADRYRYFLPDGSRVRHWAELDRWQKLTLFDAIYNTNEIAVGAVNVIKRFANSCILPITDDPKIAQRMKEVWDEIDGHNVNAQILEQFLVMGFACPEWVSEDMTRMDRVVVPPSIEMRKVPNVDGQVVGYIQYPGFRPGKDGGSERVIPAGKIVDVVRDPSHAFDYYGTSMFESAVDQFESLCQILDAQIKVMMRIGKPRFQVLINAEGLTEEEFRSRIDQAKTAMTNLGDEDAADIYMPTGCEVKIIGAESFGARFADEVRNVLQMLACVCGVPPELLNIETKGSGGAESAARQKIIALQTMVGEIQRTIARAWNKYFWPVVAALEGWPSVPSMEFQTPRLLDQTIEESARDLQWKNDFREVVAGIRPAEWLVQQCGATTAADSKALTDMIERAREGGLQEDSKQPESANAESNTKVTDKRATGNKSI